MDSTTPNQTNPFKINFGPLKFSPSKPESSNFWNGSLDTLPDPAPSYEDQIRNMQNLSLIAAIQEVIDGMKRARDEDAKLEQEKKKLQDSGGEQGDGLGK